MVLAFLNYLYPQGSLSPQEGLQHSLSLINHQDNLLPLRCFRLHIHFVLLLKITLFKEVNSTSPYEAIFFVCAPTYFSGDEATLQNWGLIEDMLNSKLVIHAIHNINILICVKSK